MGCWNETCMLTRLPILEGERAAAVLLAQRPDIQDMSSPDCAFMPISLPVVGEYNEYGGLENIQKDPAALHVLANAELLLPRNQAMPELIAKQYPNWEKQDGWENIVCKIIDAAKQGELEIKQRVTGWDFHPVYVVFIKADYIQLIQNMLDSEFLANFTQDMAYCLSLSDPIRIPLINREINGKDLATLASLDIFMNQNRIAWAPTCGAGSQQSIDTDIQLKFYQKMAQDAQNLHNGVNQIKHDD